MGSLGFYTGLSALNAAQLALRTIGHNVANVNTEGFSRRRTLGGPNDPIRLGQHLVGTGVSVDLIQRTVNEQLEARLRSARAMFGRVETENSIYSELEAAFAEPSDQGLSSRMSNFFSAVADLSTSPDDPVRAASMVHSGGDLATGMRDIAARIQSQLGDLDTNLEFHVDRLNELSREASDLNRQIGRIEAGGQTADDLRDRLGVVVQEMATEANVEVIHETGGVRILLEGRALVSGDHHNELHVDRSENRPRVMLGQTSDAIDVSAGVLGALDGLRDNAFGRTLDSLDSLAAEWILEVNRIHSRGTPPGGGFRNLTALNAVRDRDGDGAREDELLSESGLPFDLRSGELFVSIVDVNSGRSRTTSIDLHPESMTVGDLIAELNSIEDLNASLDEHGRLRLQASNGRRFNFSGELESQPDRVGAFGGTAAAVTSQTGEPFALSLPADFTVAVDGGTPQTVTLDASMFANPGHIAADELAAAIDAQLSGASAVAQGGRLSLVSDTSGTASTLQLAEGASAPLATLGLSTAAESGSALDVSPRISGTYTGPENTSFRFVALGDGEIGVTPGLQIAVLDATGQRVATLDVGPEYVEGDELDVSDGIQVSFQAGSISATAGDSFELQAIANSDTADLLPAFGINAFFEGHDASTIAVNANLLADPSGLATGISSSAVDNTRLQQITALQNVDIDALGGLSLEAFYTNFISELGFETARAERLMSSQAAVVEDLEVRRDQHSGVSLDEELALMMQYEEAYTAATRYIQTIQGMNQEILNLV